MRRCGRRAGRSRRSRHRELTSTADFPGNIVRAGVNYHWY
jgi:hypothetical protein